MVHMKLDQHVQALAALSTGAAHNPDYFDFFAARARELGAWRVAPPLSTTAQPAARRVRRLISPTRAQFSSCVLRREPVIVSDFALTALTPCRPRSALPASTHHQERLPATARGVQQEGTEACVWNAGSKRTRVQQQRLALESFRSLLHSKGMTALKED